MKSKKNTNKYNKKKTHSIVTSSTSSSAKKVHSASKELPNIHDKVDEKSTTNTSKRLRLTMLFFFFLLLALVLRIAWLQFVQGASLKEMMYTQLITSRLISPSRGAIYDSTGKQLAVSAKVDTVSVNPSRIVITDDNDKIDETKTKAHKEKVAKAFSDIFELDYEATLEKVSKDTSIATIIARKVEKDKIDKLREWMKNEDIYSGINIDEDTKRYYPYENLASSLIGFCGDDNQGLEGLEASWDSVLTGTPGKVVTATDAIQEFIPDENQTYIPAENGSDITLTIDVNVQAIVEKYLKQACIDTKCSRGGNAIVMNPKTGDILAMATYPDYNLNTPFTPINISEKDWKKMNSTEQNNTLQSLYRNRATADTYEPGSVFKIITASVALEENLASVDKKNVYSCNGYQTIAGSKIWCSVKSGHGHQSLREALENSCNPAFIQLAQKVGKEKLYKYYDAYGFFDKTGVNSSGEANSTFWELDNVGPLELATMSFGQRFKITPLQMITAICAVANDGILVEPRLVKEIKNTDTDAITNIETSQVRQVISKETASKLMNMLESVVTDGTGKYAKVQGYSIAGKTGTSEPDPGNTSEGYTASFVGISPAENPEVVVLVAIYGLTGINTHGSTVAAPVVGQIFTEILPYLQVVSDASSSTNSSNATTTLPNVTNRTVSEAKKILKSAGFTVSTSASDTELVIDQFPKKGTQLIKNATIKLYSDNSNTRVSKEVPDLKGKSLSQVKNILKEKNLNLNIVGSGSVVSQDPIAGTSVEEGSVIKVTLH